MTASASQIEQNDSAVVYSGGWFTNSGGFNSGASAALAIDAGAKATVTFSGSAISWVAYRDEWSGIARVHVDGALKGTVDTFAAPNQAQAVVYTISGLAEGTHTLTIEVTGERNPNSGGSWVWIDAFKIASGSASAGPAAFSAAGLVNAADYSSRLSGGAIASLFGTNLAAGTAAAQTLPLPTTLGGATVRVNGVAVSLFYVSPRQINFQMPWNAAGAVQVTVSVNGVNSAAQTLNVGAAGPSLFTLDQRGSGQGMIAIANSTSLAAAVGTAAGARPAGRGEYVTLWATGLGAVMNPPAAGTAARDAGSGVMTPPSVTVGGVPAAVSFAGLAPGFAGLYQINVQVPGGAPTGNAVPVVVTVNGVAANTVTMAIQ